MRKATGIKDHVVNYTRHWNENQATDESMHANNVQKISFWIGDKVDTTQFDSWTKIKAHINGVFWMLDSCAVQEIDCIWFLIALNLQNSATFFLQNILRSANADALNSSPSRGCSLLVEVERCFSTLEIIAVWIFTLSKFACIQFRRSSFR